VTRAQRGQDETSGSQPPVNVAAKRFKVQGSKFKVIATSNLKLKNMKPGTGELRRR
jgi:hypothetical protein